MSAPVANAADQLRSMVDRILRLKQEQDAIGDDVREIYAEAKSNGFDKTQLGRLVTYLRKREKDGAAEVIEREAIFDLYLETYDAEPARAPAPARARAREIIGKSDTKSDTKVSDQADASPRVDANRAPERAAEQVSGPIHESESRLLTNVRGDRPDAIAAEAGTDGSRAQPHQPKESDHATTHRQPEKLISRRRQEDQDTGLQRQGLITDVTSAGGENPPTHSHQDGTERVSTGHPSVSNALAAVASGNSAAPITVDASIMFPPVEGDDPLTDDHGLLRIDIPDGLVRAA